MQKKGRPDAFLNQIHELAAEKDLLSPIRKLMREPYTDDKIDSSERLKLINLSYSLAKMGEKEALLSNLNGMIKKGRVDIKELNNQFIETFQSKLNVQDKVNEDELIKRLDFKYLHLLFPASKELKPNYSQKFNELVKTAIEGNYHDYIFNTQSEAGKANLRTKQIFKENGLNFDTWLNYDKEYTFTSGKGNNFSLNVWKRNPGVDFFLGNKAQNCTALDGDNKEGAIDDLLNTFVQNIEIKKDSDAVGQITVFWVKDAKDRLKLLIDSSSVAQKYINDANNSQKEVLKFLKEYGKEVSGKDTDIILGKFNHIFPMDNFKSKKMTVKPVGDCVSYTEDKPESKYYINSFKKQFWSSVKYPYRTTFYHE